MATLAASSRAATAASSTTYERFAGACAILAAVVGLVYSVSFVVLRNPTLYSAALLLGGFLGTVAMVAVARLAARSGR
jgi:hypothetical protein